MSLLLRPPTFLLGTCVIEGVVDGDVEPLYWKVLLIFGLMKPFVAEKENLTWII